MNLFRSAMPDYNLFSNTGLPERFVLTKLQVPGELDDAQLTEYFQPLLHTPGHNRSMWGMIQDKPKTALLATCKYRSGILKIKILTCS